MQNKRLLVEFERNMREINREIINPRFDELSVADLRPVTELVARARADYLEAVFQLAAACSECVPEEAEIVRLKKKRLIFDELVAAARAMETAVERGYLDVVSNGSPPPPKSDSTA